MSRRLSQSKEPLEAQKKEEEIAFMTSPRMASQRIPRKDINSRSLPLSLGLLLDAFFPLVWGQGLGRDLRPLSHGHGIKLGLGK